jgi:hypothetical protein
MLILAAILCGGMSDWLKARNGQQYELGVVKDATGDDFEAHQSSHLRLPRRKQGSTEKEDEEIRTTRNK